MVTQQEREQIIKEYEDERRKKLRIYDAEWRKKNPDKVREKNHRYYEKHKNKEDK